MQYFIIGCVMKALHKSLPDTYFAGSAQLGLRLTQDTNFSPDIAIFREGALQVGFHSTRYSDVPPNVVIEVDIKADESDYFRDEEEYFHKKTERLLQWGVERVIWVFSNSRRILVADVEKWFSSGQVTKRPFGRNLPKTSSTSLCVQNSGCIMVAFWAKIVKSRNKREQLRQKTVDNYTN